MQTQRRQLFKKSIYLFLCSLLGMLLFSIIHQLLVFLYLLFFGNSGALATGEAALRFFAFDYLSLLILLLLGSWYGIWLGVYWHKIVYEEGTFGGVIRHAMKFWPQKKQAENLETKINLAEAELDAGMRELKEAAAEVHALPVLSSLQVSKKRKKRAIRKRTVKK